MPTSPQQTARPINKERLSAFFAALDAILADAKLVSESLILSTESELYADQYTKDLVTMVHAVSTQEPLNDSEIAAAIAAYKLAGWREMKFLSHSQVPGKGRETVVVLRAIPEVFPL